MPDVNKPPFNADIEVFLWGILNNQVVIFPLSDQNLLSLRPPSGRYPGPAPPGLREDDVLGAYPEAALPPPAGDQLLPHLGAQGVRRPRKLGQSVEKPRGKPGEYVA